MNFPNMQTAEFDVRTKFARLKEAANNDPYPSLAQRRDQLQRLIDVLVKNEKRIVDTVDADFGGRPEAFTLMVDVLSAVRSLKFAHKHVADWMKPDMRKPEFPLGLIGARCGVFYQPLGVVGNMSPWNAPVVLAIAPLSSMLAAGNRVLMRPSEMVPQTAELIAEMIRSAFDPTEIEVCTGDVEVSRAFAALPFDHLLFTGGSGTARHILRAAAENLTPVTLELGGKAPCIVAKGSDLAYAAQKFALGKCINAGQICMSPDFAYVHRSEVDAFAEEVRKVVKRMYPDYARGKDFTNVHLPRQREHLLRLARNAVQSGARVEVLDGTPLDQLGEAECFPPVLVVNPPFDSEIMRDEVFGPLIPVVAYDTLDEVHRQLMRMPRPLALYFIGGTQAEKDEMLRKTYSGGVSFDDVQFHIMMQDYGQGGVGESGMGRYLGFDGFKCMSNARAFAQRGWIDVTKYIAPPYKPGFVNALRKALKH